MQGGISGMTSPVARGYSGETAADQWTLGGVFTGVSPP